MARFVVDNSVVVAWGLNEESAYADAILRIVPDADVIAPSVWPVEFGNVLVVAERRKRLTAMEVTRLRDLVAALRISVVPEPPGRVLTDVLALARQEKLSTYDASYLDLAIREGVPMATLDAALRDAAIRRGVPVMAAGS